MEIKPHTTTGIRAGVRQIGDRLEAACRTTGVAPTGVLVTYVGVDAAGRPIRTGRAKAVHVYGAKVDLKCGQRPTVAQYNQPGVWYFLGSAPLPDKLDHPPVDHAPAFGWAVEPVVQQQVMKTVRLQTPQRKWTPKGGPGHGADIEYTELAEFYRELARELRDPFYAELASELASGHGALLRAA
jgi:hypothetical protein